MTAKKGVGVNVRRIVLVSMALAVAVPGLGSVSQAASDYTIPAGSGDFADMGFYEETPNGPFSIYVSVFAFGTYYYGGIPPENQGGVGDQGVCFSYQRGDLLGTGCINEGDWSIDPLASARVSDTMELELRDNTSGTVVGTEIATVELVMNGNGPLFPGIRAQSNPSPGAELESSILRNATVTGTVQSPTLGLVDLGGRPAVLRRADCIAFMAGEDNVEACRF